MQGLDLRSTCTAMHIRQSKKTYPTISLSINNCSRSMTATPHSRFALAAACVLISLSNVTALAPGLPTTLPKQAMLKLLDGPTETDPNDIFVCPESLAPLKKVHRYFGFIEQQYLQSQEDSSTKYNILPGQFVDLTIKKDVSFAIGETLFQTKLLPAIYERGYRKNFENAGFPGIEKEFAEVNEFFTAGGAQTILDLSCGSGFMTRKFVASKNYARVIAGDLSPTMLEETRRRCISEGITPPELVRCDSSRLPFASNSLDAIHAGAAMHCWPRVSEALAEIYRVLKPGGLYFASTFVIGNFNRLPTGGGFALFESPEELNTMVSKAGFSNSGGATVVRKEGRGCVIIKSMKSPIPEKGTPGIISELFNDSFKASSGAIGEARLTIEEALAVATPTAGEEAVVTAEVAAVAEVTVEDVVAGVTDVVEDSSEAAAPANE